MAASAAASVFSKADIRASTSALESTRMNVLLSLRVSVAISTEKKDNEEILNEFSIQGL